MITVSHDRYFLDRGRKDFAFEGDGKLQQYEGGFTDYQAAKAEREAKLAEARRRIRHLRRSLRIRGTGQPQRAIRKEMRRGQT